MILTGQINGMEIMLMVKLKKDVLRGGNMYSGWEQKTRTDLNAGLKEFESTPVSYTHLSKREAPLKMRCPIRKK